MGAVELWLEPAGHGKTRRALSVLRAALDRDWRSARFLVPTVGQKRSIEHLLLEQYTRQGLFGDPVNIFFTFAQEVAQRGGVRGERITELQKHLLLKEIVRTTPLDYFQRAAGYPGFAQALGESIDELKVHMVLSEDLLAAATVARERGASDFAQKIFELGTLYAQYQQRLIAENLYDNEGIMWLAADCLREQPELFTAEEMRLLILDGFARLTPIQLHFLRALAPRVEQTILLFDYEDGRSMAYHPVQASLDRLYEFEERDGLRLVVTNAPLVAAPCRNALEFVRSELFRDRKREFRCDDSISLLLGATPAQEIELIAREVRALLRAGRLPDGTPITPADIAIIARNGEHLRETVVRTFRRFDLVAREDPPLLAHTSVGRALLAVFRLVRDRWKREDVLTLLKGGFLPIDPALAFHIDLIARRHYLRDRRATWTTNWPDEATREALQAALAPLTAVDEHFHRQAGTSALMTAITDLLRVFRANALPDIPPLPDVDTINADRYAALLAAFTHVERILDDLQRLDTLVGGFRHEELLDIIITALLRETAPAATLPSEGIPVLSAHATGGEKFKVVFLCNLRQGVFPRHQRESAFLMDHEREETLRDLNILIETRKHLEDDEQFWFLHSLSAASHRVVLSYPQHDMDGRPLERSAFLDEVERILPDITAHVRKTSFRDVVPPLPSAENPDEYLAGLAHGLRTVRDETQLPVLAAAYAGTPAVHGPQSTLAALFRRAQCGQAALADHQLLYHFMSRRRPFSASELQGYIDCPFLWFGRHCLGVEPVVEEFSPLDRGVILHGVLEQLYRRRQERPGQPVNLASTTLDDLWPEVEADLRARLEAEPRFQNRAAFLRDIEWENLSRMMQRFVGNEIERAQTRQTHPAYFEQRFGSAAFPPLMLGGGALSLLGTMDRVDLCDDDPTAAIVVDYKSSAGMTLKALEQGEVLQAPIYALAVQRLLHLQPLGAEFMGLKQGTMRGIYREGVSGLYGMSQGMKELTSVEWTAYLDRCEETLCAVAARLRDGQIALTPTTNRCSDSCEYFAVCRGDRFALERMRRETRRPEERALVGSRE